MKLISAKRGVFLNAAITIVTYAVLITFGGLWGVVALQVWAWVIIGAHGAPAVAFSFIVLLMLPWAVPAVFVALRVFDEWMDVANDSKG
ncbi:MAG TPA: hypothetical protein VJX23_16870 [Candidatus Binataceae bacterium]|nr:hypothetical protein [Candidatus Binataceae bacterium]